MATTNPLGRHPPHLVGNTELSFWGTSIDNSVGVLDFFFFFVSICLSMCQLLCVSVHLFTFTLKFLNVSLVPGLGFKKCRLLIKAIRNSFKNHGGGISDRV